MGGRLSFFCDRTVHKSSDGYSAGNNATSFFAAERVCKRLPENTKITVKSYKKSVVILRWHITIRRQYHHTTRRLKFSWAPVTAIPHKDGTRNKGKLDQTQLVRRKTESIREFQRKEWIRVNGFVGQINKQSGCNQKRDESHSQPKKKRCQNSRQIFENYPIPLPGNNGRSTKRTADGEAKHCLAGTIVEGTGKPTQKP